MKLTIKYYAQKTIFSAAIASVLLSLSGLPSYAASIIVNGTFDDQSGWTGSFINQPGGSGGFPLINTGPYYYGGNNAFNEITQVHVLDTSELTSLGTTGLGFLMSADLFGFSSQSDFSTFSADFRDAGNASLGSVSLTSTTNDPGTWANVNVAGAAPNFQQLIGSLNVLTRSILFTVSSTRNAGSANDGYLDNAFFELSPSNVSAVPVPAALPLFASGLGFFGFLGWRKKRLAATAA